MVLAKILMHVLEHARNIIVNLVFFLGVIANHQSINQIIAKK